MKYNTKLILAGLLFWLGSFFWLVAYGNQAPLQIYLAISQLLASLEIQHSAATLESITRYLVSILLFINITVWSAILYKQTVFKWMQPPKKPPAPKPPVGVGPEGSIIINQHFGTPKPADAAKK